jgi:hypothetical protein
MSRVKKVKDAQHPTPFQRSLTPDDVTRLCDAARRAWEGLPGRATSGLFVWRGRRLRVRHSTFRLYVDEPDGTPVCFRYD